MACAIRSRGRCGSVVAAASVAQRRRRAPAADAVHRRHRRGRHPVRPQQRRLRQEVPARNDGLRRARSSTPTATAGRTCCSSTRRTGRAGRPPKSHPRCTATTTTARSPTSRAGPASTSRCTASAPPRPTSTTTARSTSTSPALGGNHLFRNLGGGKFADVTRDGRRRRRGLLDERAVVRLRQRRQARSVRRPLRRLVDREGPVLHARRQEQVVLHARVVQGPEPDALSQPRQRHVRGRDEAGGPLRPDVEGARRRDARLRRRRLDGPVRRQRHAAEPALSQQAATARSPTSRVGAGVAFSEAGVARAGMGVDAADYDGSGRPSLVIGNFSNEMMALYHNEGNGLFIDEAPTSTIGTRVAADADLRLLLLRLRPRRPARHLRRQRPRRRRHRARAAARHLRAARRTCSATPGRSSSRT